MNEWKLALNDQQLVSTEVRATGEVHPVNRNEQKRLKKSCTGCGDTFTCYQQNNYDYCRNCAINGHIVTVPGDISLIFVQSVAIDQGVV